MDEASVIENESVAGEEQIEEEVEESLIDWKILWKPMAVIIGLFSSSSGFPSTTAGLPVRSLNPWPWSNGTRKNTSFCVWCRRFSLPVVLPALCRKRR